MIIRLLMLTTSFAPAMGNYGFLIGLENQPDYMFFLSFSSCFAGIFCYGFLPIISSKYPPKVVFLSIITLWFIGCATFFGTMSISASLVLSTIFLFVCAEIYFAATSQWIYIYSLRALMCGTGILSWLETDFAAILVRTLIVGFAAALLLIKSTSTLAPSLRKPPSLLLLLSLVSVNLVWVYLLPLILIHSAIDAQKLTVYLITTIVPLMYFKAQDAVFKVDVVAAVQIKSSSFFFMSLFAVPLVFSYCAFPVLVLFDSFSIPLSTVLVFSAISLLLLFLNLYLTNKLAMAKMHEAFK